MHTKTENDPCNLTHNVQINKGSNIKLCARHTHTQTHKHICTHHTQTHMHTCTHILQMDRGEGQCCLTEIFGEEKCLEFAFEERENSSAFFFSFLFVFTGSLLA